MSMSTLQRSLGLVLAVSLGVGFLYFWPYFQEDDVPEGFARSNGRIEAVQIDVATRVPGRVSEIYVQQGDFLESGQIVASMDVAAFAAQLMEAEARLRRASVGIDSAKFLIKQREAEKAVALAVVEQREAEHDAAKKQLDRSKELAGDGAIAQRRLDEDIARYFGSVAAVSAAKAQVGAVEAALSYAGSQVIAAESDVEAAQATIQRIRTDLDDGTLKSPRDGRVQYLVAQPGEVLPAGGTVLSLVDLSDVYMTFFLPTDAAGKVAIGAEAHLILDAVQQYVIPARISFVADIAQFTPKTVETEAERQKLMFQVQARIDPELLRKYLHQVKTGLPGMAYVRMDPEIDWPKELQVRLPQ